MIVTVTPNPSVDRTLAISRLVRGEVHRADSLRSDPAGKGVNISRALAAHGLETVAVVPTGGPVGKELGDLLQAAKIAVAAFPISGNVRSNISVVEPDGTVTKINEPGPTLSASEVALLLTTAVAASTNATWAVVSGSLPPGAPEDLYAQLVTALRPSGALVAVDSSGPPLAAALPAGPDIIKPNLEELRELTGQRIATLGDVVEAAQKLRAGGVGAVLTSLGKDGAVLVDAGGVLYANATVDKPLSTVGAGDATLAGFVSVGGTTADSASALTEAVAWGAAAVALPGTVMPTPGDIDRSKVQLDRHPDLARPLEGPA